MAFLKFGGKKGRQDEDMDEEVLTDGGLDGSDAEGGGDAPSKKKKGKGLKKRKKGMMPKLFQESVWSQARESFEGNRMFIGTDADKERCYFGLAITEEALREVDKLDKEVKGSFVNYVENGNILAYASEETLDAGFVVVIPTKDTMENLCEFTALAERDMDIARVYPDGRAVLNGYEIGCEDIYNLVTGKAEAVDLGDDVVMSKPQEEENAPEQQPEATQPETVIQEVWEDDGELDLDTEPEPAPMPDPEPEPVDTTPFETLPEGLDEELGQAGPADAYPEENMPGPDLYGQDLYGSQDGMGDSPEGLFGDPGFGPGMQDVQPEMDPYGAGPIQPEGFDDGYINPGGGLFGEGDDTYTEGGEEEAPGAYVARQLEVITQTFCPDDLNLEVSTAPFDAQFGNMDMVLFTETRPDGFFSEWLNTYCSVANVSLLQMRERNVNKLREMYLSLMGRVCEQISQDLNVDDPTKDTKFVRMKNSILDQKEQNEARMQEKVAELVASIDRDWEESLNHQMQIAADRAKLTFTQNFGRQHAQRKLDVESEVRTAINVEYNSQMNELQDLRRKAAGMMLDLGVNAVLAQISARYQAMQDQEQALYEQYTRDINQYINDSRADEMARLNILANEQRQKAEAVRVREEMESRMASDAEGFKRKAADYESQIRKLEADMERRLKERDNTYREQLKSAQSVEKDLRNTIRQKDSAMGTIEAKVKAEYEHQLAVKDDLLKSGEERYQSQIASMEEHNRYARKMNLIAFVGASIAMLFFGMLLGAFLFRGSAGGEKVSAYDSRVESTLDADAEASLGPGFPV